MTNEAKQIIMNECCKQVIESYMAKAFEMGLTAEQTSEQMAANMDRMNAEAVELANKAIKAL